MSSPPHVHRTQPHVAFVQAYNLITSPLLYIRQDFVFHNRLLEIANSALLRDTLGSLRIMASAFAGGVIRTVSEGTAEHHRIVEAMRRGDAEAAETAMRLHIRKSTQKLADEAELGAVSTTLTMNSGGREARVAQLG